MSEPLSILIVEDEALIAMELQMMLEDAGHTVVGWATSSREARQILKRSVPDLALVDLNLSDGRTGQQVGQDMARSGKTMVVFVTANAAMLPDDLAGAHAVMPKPISSHAFGVALSYLVEGVHRPPPRGTKPAHLRLAPHLEEAWSAGG